MDAYPRVERARDVETSLPLSLRDQTLRERLVEFVLIEDADRSVRRLIQIKLEVDVGPLVAKLSTFT